MKKITIILILLFFVSPCFSADFYIAQTAVGGNTGTDCGNAHSAAWFNTAGNWGVGTGQISAGDTVHLCGTISTALTIQGSGVAGSPITIAFEAGAKLSKAHWNQSGSNGDAAIYGSSKSYITIDGGANGIIESTDNGTGKTYQLHSVGVTCIGCSHIEIKNVTCQTMYARVTGSDANAVGGCFRFTSGGHDLKIHDNVVYDGNVPIYIAYSTSGTDKDIFIYNNTGGRAGEGVVVIGSSGTGATIDNVQIYNNTFTKGLEWSGQGAIHTNLMHIYAAHSSSSVTNLKVYNNSFTGQCGTNATSLVYLADNIISPQVYNNIFGYSVDVSTQGCGNGHLFILGNTAPLIANNTFYTQVWQGIGIGTSSSDPPNSNITIYNNLFYKIAVPIYDVSSTTGAVTASDYNVFYSSPAPEFAHGTHYRGASFAQWKTHTGFDGNSTLSEPTIDTNFAPTAADSIARDTGCSTLCGIDLTGVFTTDKNAVTRPQGTTWDIGAYEYIVQRLLTINPAGTGSGTVTSSPAGINCGGDCTENYNDNTEVTLTGVAMGGSTFAGWSGEGCSGTGTCVVTLDAAHTVTATFNLNSGTAGKVALGTGAGHSLGTGAGHSLY